MLRSQVPAGQVLAGSLPPGASLPLLVEGRYSLLLSPRGAEESQRERGQGAVQGAGHTSTSTHQLASAFPWAGLPPRTSSAQAEEAKKQLLSPLPGADLMLLGEFVL